MTNAAVRSRENISFWAQIKLISIHIRSDDVNSSWISNVGPCRSLSYLDQNRRLCPSIFYFTALQSVWQILEKSIKPPRNTEPGSEYIIITMFVWFDKARGPVNMSVFWHDSRQLKGTYIIKSCHKTNLQLLIN